MKMKPEAIASRLEFARSVGFDHIECSKAWRISRFAAKHFIMEHARKPERRTRPEYENQRMFDLQVMTREQWCAKWDIPLWEYSRYLAMYQKKHGFIATPEIRQQWEKEYWEKMG